VRASMVRMLWKPYGAAALTAGLLISSALSATSGRAQTFEGCPSTEILARFEEFGRTGKMPHSLGYKQSLQPLCAK